MFDSIRYVVQHVIMHMCLDNTLHSWPLFQYPLDLEFPPNLLSADP